MSPDLLEHARQLLAQRFGLRFDARNRELLELGLRRAAATLKLSAAELLERLEREEPVLQSVLREVTIGETYFFRHPEHFGAVRELILQDLLRRGRPIRAWSAGCATGEEAYSLAIALGSQAACDWKVLGTDINRSALEVARRGLYGRWSVRNDLARDSGYLSLSADGSVEVTARLKERVRFDYLNLHDPLYPTQGLDLILCRNLLVYLVPQAAAAILERLHDCLVEGGYLVVGALDLDFAPPGFERIVHQGSIVLRRLPAAPRAMVPSVPAPPPPAATKPPASPEPRALAEAKEAADRGELERATTLAREAVRAGRSPAALHLLALILGERGDSDEPIALLREACERAPDHVLVHLHLALDERAGQASGRARLLRRVLELLEHRADRDLLPGPDPLPVSWARKMANAALRKLEAS